MLYQEVLELIELFQTTNALIIDVREINSINDVVFEESPYIFTVPEVRTAALSAKCDFNIVGLIVYSFFCSFVKQVIVCEFF